MQLIDQAENRITLRERPQRWAILLCLVFFIGGTIGMAYFAFGNYTVCQRARSSGPCLHSYPAMFADRIGATTIAFLFAGIGFYGLVYNAGTHYTDYQIEKSANDLALTIDRHWWTGPITHTERYADRVLLATQRASNGSSVWVQFMDGDRIVWTIVMNDQAGLGDMVTKFLGTLGQTGMPSLDAILRYIAKSLPIIGPLLARMGESMLPK